MMGIDERISHYQMQFIQWFLVKWHWITETVKQVYVYMKNIYNAILTSNKPIYWVFLDSNSLPYCVKGDENVVKYEGSLVFSLTTFEFISNGRLQPRIPQRFDVVSVKCVRGSGLPAIDMTGFFHTVSWKQGGAPSLIEVVAMYGILYCEKPFSMKEIHTFSLEILDSDADEHTIPLFTSRCANGRFCGWALPFASASAVAKNT